jgi:hypothetical protein
MARDYLRRRPNQPALKRLADAMASGGAGAKRSGSALPNHGRERNSALGPDQPAPGQHGYNPRANNQGGGNGNGGGNNQGGGGNGGGGGNNQGGGGGGNGGGGKDRALAELLESMLSPNAQLSGDSLLDSAQALTRLQVRPQVTAYNRLIDELERRRRFETQGLARLGRDVNEDIETTYEGLGDYTKDAAAQQRRIAGVLSGQAQAAGEGAIDAYGNAVEGDVGSYLSQLQQRGGVEGSAAQQELAALAGQQQAALAGEAAYGAGLTSATSQNFAGLAAAMGGAAQMQGAEAQSDARRAIAQRIAESRMGYGADIREALGAKKDVQALRGESTLQNLMNLRESERNFLLSKLGISLDRKALSETQRSNMASEMLSLLGIAQDESDSKRDAQQDAQEDKENDPNKGVAKDIRATAETYIDEALGNKDKLTRSEIDDIRSTLTQDFPDNPALVRRILRKLLKPYTSGGGGGGGGSNSGGGGGGGGGSDVPIFGDVVNG